MIAAICFGLFVITMIALCSMTVTEGVISKKLGGASFLIIAVLFIVFAFVFEPKNFIRWDLLQHFNLVEQMRYGGLDFALNESQYADLFIYNYFVYFISLLPVSLRNILCTIPLIIDFAITGYIYGTMYKKHLKDANGKVRILSILLWLCTFGMKLAISGIRCSLAVSLVVLAIYLEMIQKKKKIVAIPFYILAIFIHNFALVPIAVRILSMIKKPVIIMLASLITSFSIRPIVDFLLNHLTNEYLIFTFRRVSQTLGYMSFSSALETFSSSILLVYLCFIVLSVYLFIIATRAKRAQTEDGFSKRVSNFAATVGAVAIGLCFNYLYLERFMYLMSFAFLMITPIHNNKNNSINGDSVVLLPLALFVFFFNDIYIFIVNYLGYYFLAF